MTIEELQHKILGLEERVKTADAANTELKATIAAKDKEMDEIRRVNGKLLNKIGAIIDDEPVAEEKTPEQQDQELVDELAKMAIGG